MDCRAIPAEIEVVTASYHLSLDDPAFCFGFVNTRGIGQIVRVHKALLGRYG